MPENEPNQTISKVYGRLIPSDQLPLSNDRVIQYTPSCCSLPFESKNANELLDYVVDMMQWLEPNEQIIGVAGWCDPDSLIMTRLEYASTGVVAWLAGGGDDVRQTVNLQISTNLGRVKLFQFIVHTVGLYDSLAFVIAQDAAVIVGDNSGGGVTPDPEPLINVYPNTFEFPDTSTIIGQSSQTFIVKNDGDATAFIRAISLTGPFTQYNAGITKLDPGAFIQITVTYKPITLGDHTGAISIDIGEGLTQHATFTGTGVSGSHLQTSGNQIVRPGVGNVKLKSINWFGAETEVFVPHGLWARNYKDIIDQIADLGFNCVRLPFSGDICNTVRAAPDGSINFLMNDDLIELTAIEVFDAIVSYFNEKKIWIILDHHRCFAGDGADGSPIADGYGLDQWKNSWKFMVNRYADLEYVLGADLHNEPYRLEWVTWAAYAEDAANTILDLAPHWLIFVEGVARVGTSSYWWGGELTGVIDRPINLMMDGRLVYSVHEYGISVGEQDWLAKDSVLPPEWPYNLYNVWREHWGFIFEQNIAPIFIGEVGGKFGIDGNGVVTNTLNSQFERQWIYHLQRYMDGYFLANNERHLSSDQLGMSFSYWSLNPNSGDTGGILQDDWLTEQSLKLRLISMMLNNTTLPEVFGLTPIPWQNIGDDAQFVLNQDGTDYVISVTDLKNALNERTFEAGFVFFFAEDIDPNTKFPGQTWVLVPGAGKTVRLAASDGSDVLDETNATTVNVTTGSGNTVLSQIATIALIAWYRVS